MEHMHHAFSEWAGGASDNLTHVEGQITALSDAYEHSPEQIAWIQKDLEEKHRATQHALEENWGLHLDSFNRMVVRMSNLVNEFDTREGVQDRKLIELNEQIRKLWEEKGQLDMGGAEQLETRIQYWMELGQAVSELQDRILQLENAPPNYGYRCSGQAGH